jgi:hypothetical protein
MNRTAMEIACTGMEDLYEVQEALNGLRAIFTLLTEKFPESHLTNDLGQLGIRHIDDWSTKVAQWGGCMADELDDAYEDEQAKLADVVAKVSAERRHATRWWTCLNEMRLRNELPDWAAAGELGRGADHDAWLADRALTDAAIQPAGGTQASAKQVEL